VYLTTDNDTTRLRISGDGGVTWIIVDMIPGFYTVAQINAAISNALVANGFLLPANINNPPIYLGITPVDQRCYVILDTTKATVGTVQIGISFDLYDTWQLVGFDAVKTFILDGTYAADTIPFIDYQGSSIAVTTSFQGSRWVNGIRSNIMAQFPIPFINRGDITYPSYNTLLLSPYTICDIPRVFTGYTVNFINPRTGKDLVFLYGDVSLTIDISLKKLFS
jgi:hypothetical protein